MAGLTAKGSFWKEADPEFIHCTGRVQMPMLELAAPGLEFFFGGGDLRRAAFGEGRDFRGV